MANSEHTHLPDHIGKRVDPTYSNKLQLRLKELLNINTDSFPGSQPVNFESKHIEDIQKEDYFVCEKSDGVRYLLFFLHSPKGPASFLYDRNRCWYYIPNLVFPLRGRENEFLKDTLMDGELVLDIESNKKTWRYLVFDLMVINGSTVIQRSFSTRLGMLQQDIIQPFNNSIRSQLDTSKLPPFTIELKRMERSYGLHLVFDQIPKLNHRSDGIIWTPVKHPYKPGICDKLLKWKPPEMNTADFRISAKWSKEHKPIYSIEILSHGVTYKFYDHFQPDTVLASEWKKHLPDGRIAEFRYDPECEITIVEQGYAPLIRKGGWRFVKFRDDKSVANDENTVKSIQHSVVDGVTKEQLLLCMDRVRAAWKAREKGLAMPITKSEIQSPIAITPAITPHSGYFPKDDVEDIIPTTPSTDTPNGKRTFSVPYIPVKDVSIDNRRSNSIPLPPETPKKKQKSSNRIENLLIDNEDTVNRAYDFATILQKDKHNKCNDTNKHNPFINFHADINHSSSSSSSSSRNIRKRSMNTMHENRYPEYNYPNYSLPYAYDNERAEHPLQSPPEPKRKDSNKSNLDFILN